MSYRSFPTWPQLDKNQINYTDEKPSNNPLISHVIIALKLGEDDILNQLKPIIQSWSKYPPCMSDSFPIRTEKGGTFVNLLIYLHVGGGVSQSESKKIFKKIHEIYKLSGINVKKCFHTFDIKIFQGSGSVWHQEMFGQILATKKVSHALLLTEGSTAVRVNWLNELNNVVMGSIIDPAWIWGSIYLGFDGQEVAERSMGDLIGLSASGIYNLADETFSQFYLERVIPWSRKKEDVFKVQTSRTRRLWSHEIFEYLSDYGSSSDWYGVAHRFRHTSLISDHRNSLYASIDRVKQNFPEAIIICM